MINTEMMQGETKPKRSWAKTAAVTLAIFEPIAAGLMYAVGLGVSHGLQSAETLPTIPTVQAGNVSLDLIGLGAAALTVVLSTVGTIHAAVKETRAEKRARSASRRIS
ncbi:MAG TPA: hypothetical protein VF189_01355 [Patescibacteria group bacterium]